ncbi:MAG: 50S ribosomal protein L29 [Proteobacteria bacterium]|nr:50S ribosomal protein L29 [Pseudomonadota bacterium]NCA27761.1 50S ribosomal protein L29 [Pseudomonadota bacterium]
MIEQDKKTMLQNIYIHKMDLLRMRIKRTSGDENPKKMRAKRKEIARIFTKLNNKK